MFTFERYSLLRGHILCNLDIWDQIKCSKSVHILEVYTCWRCSLLEVLLYIQILVSLIVMLGHIVDQFNRLIGLLVWAQNHTNT